MFRKLLSLILITALAALPGTAQNPTQPQPQTATTLAFPLINPPVPPPTLNIAISGAPGPSSSTVFYWLVANFAIGNSSPSGPFQAFNVPTTLSGGNFEILNWPAVAGALTYDVLKTSTAAPPTGACACAVVVGTSAITVNDQSNSTSAYTVNTFASQSATVVIDNEGSGVNGVAGLVARQGGALYQVPDGQYIIPPSDCGMFATVGAFAANPAGAGGLTAPGMVRVAANNWVLQGVTTAAANSIAVYCDLNPPTRTTAGRGAKITGIQLFYGVQTTALTSITAPTLSTVTYPATGAAAGATVGTSAGGTLTVTPTLQLATTTSGQCYSENIALGTPITLNNTLQRLTIEQIFNQAAAAATQLQFCGAIVYYTNVG
jgi:hypothetical protein